MIAHLAALFALLVVWPSALAWTVVRTFKLRCEGHGFCEGCGARAWQCDCGET